MTKAWYNRYDEYRAQVDERRKELELRIPDPDARARFVGGMFPQLLSRAIRESNWQERIQLDEGETKALTELAVRRNPNIKSQVADTDSAFYNQLSDLAVDHEEALTRGDISSVEKLATINLAYVHLSQYPIIKLIEWRDENQKLPLIHVEELHFLHRTLMRNMKCDNIGRFRSGDATITNTDTLLPAPGDLPQYMDDFCNSYPPVPSQRSIPDVDEVLNAAKLSHSFVRIHPYSDGNGRISRLLMNMYLLQWGHPPIAIKAHKKHRTQYLRAIRCANRNRDKNRLACLIAQGLIDAYDMLLDARNLKIDTTAERNTRGEEDE